MAKNLLIDIGNTSVKWATSDAARSILTMHQQQYPDSLNETFFTGLWDKESKPEKVLVSCVAGKYVWQTLDAAIQSLWDIKAQRVLSQAVGCGVINAYSHPSDLGSDRWCALVGAFHAIDSDIMVVDCGSAITIDMINQAGQHRGGYILPGTLMMKQSLGRETAQVRVEADSEKQTSLAPAKTTSGCVNAAVELAAVSFIEAAFKQQLKNLPSLICVLTGGDADLIADHLTIEYVMMPDVILRGLAFIAERESV